MNPVAHGRTGAAPLLVTDAPSPALLAAWDDLVRSVPGSDVTQLGSWTRARRGAGFRPTWLLVLDGPAVLAGAQVLHRRIPVVGEIGYLPSGPVLGAAAHDRADVRDALATALTDLVGTRLGALFVQPSDEAADLGRDLLGRGFRPSDAGVAPAATLRLDLTRSEEDLHRGLSKRLRQWTRAWPSRGVAVRPGSADDLPLLAALLADSARHQGYSPPSAAHLGALWDALAPSGAAELLVGEVDGTPVTASLFTRCGTTVHYRLTGLDRTSTAARALNVPAAVLWDAVLRSRRSGSELLDLGGLGDAARRDLVAGGARDESAWRSTDRFKARFGATPHVFPPAVERIGPAWLRAGYDLVRRSPRGRAAVDRARGLLRGGRDGR